MDCDVLGDVWTVVRGWLAGLEVRTGCIDPYLLLYNLPNIAGSWRCSITGIIVIIKLRGDIMLFHLVVLNKRFTNPVKGSANGVLDGCSSHD